MSGPIDTDTFVTSDLELGIDATTLNPIQEEEDTVKNDDELSLVQQGSLDHIQANVQQGDLLTSNHNIMRNSGSFGSSTVVKSSSQGSMNENTNSSFLMEEEEGRDEDEKSDATRGHDSIDIKVGDDDGDAATASVGHPGDDHQHGLRGRSEEENDQESFTTSDVKDSDSFEIVGHGEVWSNQEDLTETNEKEEDGEMNNAAAPVLDDVPARSVDDGDSDQKAVVAILDADENDELVLTDANGIAADTQVVADEIETLQEDAVPDAFEYSEVDDALAPLIQDGVGAETAKVATDGEVVNEKMQTIIHDEQVPFEAVLDTVPDAPEDDAIFTENDTDGKVTAEEVELEMDDQVDAEAVDALVEDHVNNVDGVEEQVAVEVSDALVEDMEEIKTSDIGHVEHPEDNQHIAEKVKNSDEKQLAVESIDTPIIDVVDHNEAVEENPMDDEVADIVVLDKTQDENNAPAAEVDTADAAITEEAELLDEPQIAGDETVDAPVDKIIDANEALVENPINDAPVAEAIAKDDAPVDYAVNADEALVDIPVDENIAEVIVEDITQDEIDGPTAEVTPSYDAATEDAELQNEPRVFDDSVDAPIDYTIDSDEALVENLVDDDSAHMAIEGITQDENDDAAEEVSTADDAAVDVEEHQDDPQVADESVDAPIDYAIGADEALVENPIDDNVAEVAVEDTTQDENDVAAAELSTADDAVTEEAELQDEPQVADEIADTLVDDVINADEALVENPVDDNIAKVVVEDITQYENDVAAAEVSTAEDDAVVDVEELQDEPHVADDIVESPVDDVIDANEVADDALIDILVDDDVAEVVVEDTTEVENNVAAVEVVTVDDAIVDIEEQQDEPQVVYETDEAPVDDVIDANEVAVEDITQEENDVDAAEVTPSYDAVTEEAELKDELHVPEEIVDTSADEAIDTDEALVENPVGDNVTEVAVEVSTDDNGNVPSAEVVTADDAVTEEIEQQNEPQAEEVVDALQDDAIDPYEALVDVPVDEVVVEDTTQDVNDVAAAEVSTAEDAVTEEAELQDEPQVADDIADAPADDVIYTDEALVDIPVDDVVTEIVVEDTTDNENNITAAEVTHFDDAVTEEAKLQDEPQVDDDIAVDDVIDADEALVDIFVDDVVAEVVVEDTTDNETNVAPAEVTHFDDAAVDVEEQQDDPQVADDIVESPADDAIDTDEALGDIPVDDDVAEVGVEDTAENENYVAAEEVSTADDAVTEETELQDEPQVDDDMVESPSDDVIDADEAIGDIPVDDDVAEVAVEDAAENENDVAAEEVSTAEDDAVTKKAELQDDPQVDDGIVDAPDADEALVDIFVDDVVAEVVVEDTTDNETNVAPAEVAILDDAAVDVEEQQDDPQVDDDIAESPADDVIDTDTAQGDTPVDDDVAEVAVEDTTDNENYVAAAEVAILDDAAVDVEEQQDDPQVADEVIDALIEDALSADEVVLENPIDDAVAQIDVEDTLENESKVAEAEVVTAEDAVIEEYDQQDELQVADEGADALVDYALSADETLVDVPVDQDVAEFAVLDNFHDANFVFPAEVTPADMAELQDELQVADEGVDAPEDDAIDADEAAAENHVDGDFANEEIIQDANDTATAEVVTADDAVIEEVEQQDEPQVSDENVDALVDDDIDDDAIPSHKPVNHDRAKAVILDITQDENNVAAAEVVTADDALTEEADQQDKPQVAFEGLDAPMNDTIIYNKTLVDAPADDYVAVGDITEDENDAPAAGVTPAADAVTEEGELLDEPQVAVVADAPVEVALDDELITEEAEQQDELQVANQVVDVPVGDVINDEDKTLVENPLDDVAAVSVEDIDQDEKQVLLEENNEVAGGEQSDILDKNALVVSTAATAALGVSYAATNVVSNDEEGKNNETELGGKSQLLMEARADGSEINYDDIAEKVSDKDVELPAEDLIVSTQGNTKAPSDANVTNNDDTTKATLVPTGITNASDIKGVAPSSGKKPPTARSTSVSKSSSSKYRDQPKITTFASSKIRVSTSVDEYQFKATKASAPVNNNARTPSRNKRSSSSSVSKRKSSQYLDQPKTTTFSSAKLRATKSADEYTTSKYTVSSSESRSASRSNQRSSSRSMSRSSSCGRTIHIQLYERSLAQQEEGKKRRHQVEEYLSWRDAERSGKLASCTGDFDHLQHHRTLNNFRRESFREEFLRPKKKISLDEAEQLYQRLLAHKLKIEERRKQLKEEREMREIQWFKEKFQRKIPLEEATRLYYNETALTRSRSRGRA